MRIGITFSAGEIQVLEFVLQTMLRGGSPSVATRHKDFASLCRKVMAMKQKLAEQTVDVRAAAADVRAAAETAIGDTDLDDGC